MKRLPPPHPFSESRVYTLEGRDFSRFCDFVRGIDREKLGVLWIRGSGYGSRGYLWWRTEDISIHVYGPQEDSVKSAFRYIEETWPNISHRQPV